MRRPTVNPSALPPGRRGAEAHRICSEHWRYANPEATARQLAGQGDALELPTGTAAADLGVPARG